jgi:ubiquinone/menaquinone biosynthesis C-methylase UbiE
MRKRTQAKNKDMVFEVMDATNMPYQDQEFDVTIDKGTLDALACGKVNEVTIKLVQEMTRVSKATFFISHSSCVVRKVDLIPHCNFRNYLI